MESEAYERRLQFESYQTTIFTQDPGWELFGMASEEVTKSEQAATDSAPKNLVHTKSTKDGGRECRPKMSAASAPSHNLEWFH